MKEDEKDLRSIIERAVEKDDYSSIEHFMISNIGACFWPTERPSRDRWFQMERVHGERRQ